MVDRQLGKESCAPAELQHRCATNVEASSRRAWCWGRMESVSTSTLLYLYVCNLFLKEEEEEEEDKEDWFVSLQRVLLARAWMHRILTKQIYTALQAFLYKLNRIELSSTHVCRLERDLCKCEQAKTRASGSQRQARR